MPSGARTSSARTHDPGVASVRRALSILEIVAERGNAGVTEIATELDVHKSTASRLIATLVDEQLLDRDPRSRRVQLGLGVLRLSGALGSWADLVNTARPLMQSLSEELGASVTIVALSGGQAVHIEQLDDHRGTPSVHWAGRATPLYCTSAGKLLLAFAPAAMRARLLNKPMPPLTRTTITERAVLEAQLEEVRRREVAIALGELRPDQNGVSVPIRRSDGVVVAALCVSGPTGVVGPRRIPLITAAAQRTAGSISARLGAPRRKRLG